MAVGPIVPITWVIKEFTEPEVRVESKIYLVHGKGAVGKTKRGSAPGERNWASFMAPSDHPWINILPKGA